MRSFKKVLLVDNDPSTNFLSALAFEGNVVSRFNFIGEVLIKDKHDDALQFIKSHCFGNPDGYENLI